MVQVVYIEDTIIWRIHFYYTLYAYTYKQTFIHKLEEDVAKAAFFLLSHTCFDEDKGLSFHNPEEELSWAKSRKCIYIYLSIWCMCSIPDV